MNARITKKQEIIDTGLVEFVLPFDRGEEKIYFNPNDTEFALRLTEMVDKISNIYDEYAEKYDTEKDGVEKIKMIRSLNEDIKAEFDYAFGNPVADVIFKYVSPHGVIKSKSQYFSFYILEWLIPHIENEVGNTMDKTNKALENAIKKHEAKYPHKFGK